MAHRSDAPETRRWFSLTLVNCHITAMNGDRDDENGAREKKTPMNGTRLHFTMTGLTVERTYKKNVGLKWVK